MPAWLTWPTWLEVLLRAVLDPQTYQVQRLIWPLLFGLGAALVAGALPFGRPKPDLAEVVRRQNVDERLRESLAGRSVRPFFVSPVLERVLRPLVDDAGHLLQVGLSRLGVWGLADLPGLSAAGGAGRRELEQQLRLARPGVEPAQFFGEKVAIGLMGVALLPLMNALGPSATLGTPWPVWAWVVLGIVGFLAPDWLLGRQGERRRVRALTELPTLLDLLAIAASAGQGLDQALLLVARHWNGIVARELRVAGREVALGQRTLVEALDEMARRNALPELTSLVTQLRGAHEQGLPLAHALAVQAQTLRERKRLRLLEEGGRASVWMLLPVGVFILPVLFVVLLVPALTVVLHLGG